MWRRRWQFADSTECDDHDAFSHVYGHGHQHCDWRGGGRRDHYDWDGVGYERD
jgi:hypothetical protein